MKLALVLLIAITLSTSPLKAKSSDDDITSHQNDERVISQEEINKAREQAILTLQSPQSMRDIEFAAKMGSGEPVTIDLNATEGLEGHIAQIAQEICLRASLIKKENSRIRAFRICSLITACLSAGCFYASTYTHNIPLKVSAIGMGIASAFCTVGYELLAQQRLNQKKKLQV